MLIIVALFLAGSANSQGYHLDPTLGAAVASRLHVSHCVLQSSNMQINAKNVKLLSGRFMYTTVVTVETLAKLVNQEVLQRTVVLMSEGGFSEMLNMLPTSRIPPKVFWLVKTNNIQKLIQNVYVPIDSYLYMVTGNQSKEITAIYQIKPNMSLIYQPWGTAKGDELLAIGEDIILKRLNFYQANFVLLKSLEDPCVFDMECINYNIWKDFSKTLNFSAIFVMENELKSRYGGVADGRAAIAPFHILTLSENLVAPTFSGWVNLYIKDIGTKTDTWQAYFQPLTINLWLALLSWTLTFCAGLILIHKMLGEHGLRLLPYFFTPLDAIANQSQSLEADNLSSQFSVILPRLMALVIFSAYSAAIISFLAVRMPVYPFKDIDGFRQDGSYRLGSLKDSFSILFIKYSKSSVMQDITSKMLAPENEMTTTFTEGVDLMCKDPKYAYLAYNTLVDRIATCPIRRIESPVSKAFAGLPVAQDFPYKAIFQYILLNYYSSGIVNRNEKELQWSPDVIKSHDFLPIDGNQIAIPLLILLAGITIALILLLTEVAIFKLQSNKKQPIRKPNVLLRRLIFLDSNIITIK